MTADLSMRIALTIAGSDPGGGAGIQADLKTFAAFGVYGASAITAVTVQSTRGVEAVEPLSADLVTAQIEAVAGDLRIDVTKIGMLATAAIVEAVAAAIKELELPLVVLDPVLVSSSGARLLDADGVQAMCLELLPLARAITPNIAEAEALSGRRIGSPAEARDAARRIHDMGAASVIVTGGHGPGTKDQGPGTESIQVFDEDDLVARFVVDQLVDQRARDREAQAARPQPLLFPYEGVLERVVLRIADGRVRQVLDVETLSRIGDPVEQHAARANA